MNPNFPTLPSCSRNAGRRFPFLAMLILALPRPGAESWEHLDTEDGIRVEQREIEGSDLREYRAHATLPGTPKALAQILMDRTTYAKWMPDYKESRTLDSSPGLLVAYIVSHAPWPMSDRDSVFVSRMIYKSDQEPIEIEVHSDPDAVPRHPDNVRIQNAHARWTLRPEADYKARVTYHFFLDPEASAPAWTVRRQVRRIPARAIQGLRHYLETLAVK